MRYFLYVVNMELKKNGLAVFALDQKPISRFDDIQQIKKYKNYLKYLNKKLLKERLDKSNKISYMPLISIILIINDKNFDDLKNTIDSIKNQTYDNWQIIIFSTDSLKNTSRINELIENNNSKIVFYDKLSDTFFNNIFSFNSDFMGFLDTGIELSKFALHEFISEINQHPNSEIFYSDHDYLDKNNVRVDPFFKPNWSPYLFRSMDYLSSFYIIKKTVFEKINFDLIIYNCFNFDILLQSTEITKFIHHISIPLYSIKHNQMLDVNSKKLALSNHLKRINVKAIVKSWDYYRHLSN